MLLAPLSADGTGTRPSPPPDVVDYLLHVGQLAWTQPGNLKVEPFILPQQEICADRKETGNPEQHLYGGQDVVVLPVRHALLGDRKPPCKVNLAQPPLHSQLLYPFVQHLLFPVKKFLTIVLVYLINSKHQSIVIFDHIIRRKERRIFTGLRMWRPEKPSVLGRQAGAGQRKVLEYGVEVQLEALGYSLPYLHCNGILISRQLVNREEELAHINGQRLGQLGQGLLADPAPT